MNSQETAILAWEIVGLVLGHDDKSITDKEWQAIYQKAQEASDKLKAATEDARAKMKSGIHDHFCPKCNSGFVCPKVTHCRDEWKTLCPDHKAAEGKEAN